MPEPVAPTPVPPKNLCFNCGGRGHFGRECSSPVRSIQNSTLPVCRLCGGRGHFARICPTPAHQRAHQICFICGQYGHRCFQCPQRSQSGAPPPVSTIGNIATPGVTVANVLPFSTNPLFPLGANLPLLASAMMLRNSLIPVPPQLRPQMPVLRAVPTFQPRPTPAPRLVRCYACGGFGHIARICPKALAWQQQQQQAVAGMASLVSASRIPVQAKAGSTITSASVICLPRLQDAHYATTDLPSLSSPAA
ncbi:hypothetical protein PAPYR_5864 [Paratrimastix pyriformis]|uniref:CCHC-type domain-containing protein n=1 Tax=Paratrimastix pyriformis TaxID=342808 RepID=A0ABQ8UI35_9EUKA|nr:hypothetical protein PAPYR_5864 [Paratrimastix pyriformis]